MMVLAMLCICGIYAGAGVLIAMNNQNHPAENAVGIGMLVWTVAGGIIGTIWSLKHDGENDALHHKDEN